MSPPYYARAMHPENVISLDKSHRYIGLYFTSVIQHFTGISYFYFDQFLMCGLAIYIIHEYNHKGLMS